jgi:pyocin large subunit-like protein
MNNELDLLSLAIQGGAVSISLALIWLLAKVIKGNKETVENHLTHSNKVMASIACSNLKVARALQKLTDSLNIFNGKKK